MQLEEALKSLVDGKFNVFDDTLLERFLSCVSKAEKYIATNHALIFQETFSGIELEKYDDRSQAFILRLLYILRNVLPSELERVSRSIDFKLVENRCLSALYEILSGGTLLESLEVSVPVETLVSSLLAKNMHLRLQACRYFHWLVKQDGRLQMIKDTLSLLISQSSDCQLLRVFIAVKCDLSCEPFSECLGRLLKAKQIALYLKLLLSHPELQPHLGLKKIMQLPSRNIDFFSLLRLSMSQFEDSEDREEIFNFLLLILKDDSGETIKFAIDTFSAGKSINYFSEKQFEVFTESILDLEDDSFECKLHALNILKPKLENFVAVNLVYAGLELLGENRSPHCLELFFDFVLANIPRRDFNSLWTKSDDRVKAPSLFKGNVCSDLNELFTLASQDPNWEVRETVCAALQKFLNSVFIGYFCHENMPALNELMDTFSKDVNVFVLCSALKLLGRISYADPYIIDKKMAASFFERAFDFCEDCIHSAILDEIFHNHFLKKFITQAMLHKTIESDLCCYVTKARAMKILFQYFHDQKEMRWVEEFLRNPESDQGLVREVKVSLGRFKEPAVDVDTQNMRELDEICIAIIAECSNPSVSMDCY